MKKTKTKLSSCFWCLATVTISASFDEKKQKPICSQGCRDAETLFNQLFSDESINRERHYHELTKGG